jgi:3-oxoacyl-[acyl-carrier protein] reductase
LSPAERIAITDMIRRLGSHCRHEFEIGLFLPCCHHAKQKYGKITISSIYGFTGNATRSAHAAAKAGVAVFTKSLALEVVKDGINVNAVAPGRVATDRVRSHYSDEAWAAAVAQIPMGRTGTPEEIASAVLFLATDENKYITGQTIHVNGAWLNW